MLDFVRRTMLGSDRSSDGPAAPEISERRPTVGLALGGGAARGFAHIGVLRALMARGIKPDVIAGTSIGAVVGGCYAAGRLDELEAWARSLTRRRVFGYLDFTLSGSGLIGGNRLADSLARELEDVMFEDLPIRLAAIATEIGTGHEIWLSRGRLKDALIASYSLPGLFSPTKIGGRWLMDGALVNPVPVSAARAYGARLVVAVNLNTESFGRGTIIQNQGADDEADIVPVDAAASGLRNKAERILRRQFLGVPGKPGFSTVMYEAFNVMQDRITRARLASEPPDTTISPRLNGIGFFDFHRADEAIRAGAEAAEKNLDAIVEAMDALA